MSNDTPQNQQNSKDKTGILLVNLGSPDSPTPSALRRYLAEFLWDPRIVDAPRWLWWLVLHLVILRIRPSRSARAYARVWTDEGSPLITISKKQLAAIRARLQDQVSVELAMRYGSPSVRSGLENLRASGVTRVLVLPMYPQYSHTTTASVSDAVSASLQAMQWSPQLDTINDYHRHPAYIRALADSIRHNWSVNPRGQLLLFSFHGIPQRYVDNGDPYYDQCQTTARLIATELALEDDEWKLVFQSRFGREPWLQPYCDKTLEALPSQGITRVDIISPGFSADCLETLEEIDMENHEIFIEAGGEQFQYIAALNDKVEHIDALCDILTGHLS